MFKKLLLATDFSNASKGALHAGIELAKKCNAAFLAVHVVSTLETIYGPERFRISGDWRVELGYQFNDFLADSLYPNIRREILVGNSIADEILKYARKEKCDLVVMGTHGAGLIKRIFLGSVAQRVTRDSEIPVMVVRDLEPSQTRDQGFNHVLVPADFSDTSQKAVDFGVQFSNFLRADFHLIHVVEALVFSDFSGMYPFVAVNDLQTSKALMNQTLNEMIQGKEFFGARKIELLWGPAIQQILEYVKHHHIDFVVMGTHGRKGLERVLLGSVAAGILARSSVPVITISSGPREFQQK